MLKKQVFQIAAIYIPVIDPTADERLEEFANVYRDLRAHKGINLDQARDRVWRIGQTRTVVAHRMVCPGTVDERVEEVVQGKRRIADMVLPKSSSIGDLDTDQLREALGLKTDELLTEEA